MRRAGLLLHITSLPGPYGTGDFGSAATWFLDRAAEAGVSLWQVLPLNPPGYGESPYQPWSAFAGNPLLISPELLHADGLISEGDLAGCHLEEPTSREDSRRVDFDRVHAARDRMLRSAFRRFRPDESFSRFRNAHCSWLDDAVLFAALRRSHSNSHWIDWKRELVHRDPDAIRAVRRELREEIAFQTFCQYQFFAQLSSLRERARARGIQLVGDIPMFVAHDSADVWAQQEMFKLDGDGNPTVVAGVPPDYFSEFGQRWGNPMYDWDALEESGFSWWIDRVRHALQMVDVVRVDHFRGLQASWEIPSEEPTAVNGRWIDVPGRALLKSLKEEGMLEQIFAEDLGDITPDVERLRDDFDIAGMRVLQFGFDDPDNPHLPHNFESPHVIAYTGTHDNDTAAGWFSSLKPIQKQRVRTYLGYSSKTRSRVRDIVDAMIRSVLSSTAEVAIVPVQDLLALGSESRMNRPGVASRRNWSWRMTEESLDDASVARLREWNDVYGRVTRISTSNESVNRAAHNNDGVTEPE